MGSILEKIEQAIKDLLIGWIESNLTNMFTDVNDKVGVIASEVGQTPSTWNGSIYSMIRGLSESVIVPIAGNDGSQPILLVFYSGEESGHAETSCWSRWYVSDRR